MTAQDNPFSTPPELREPARRFRGRLASPVTLWTAGVMDRPTGLTISSLVVAEGRPSSVLGLVNDTTDLWESIQETEAFVVHILEDRHRRLAERFAGMMPSPGGLFEGVAVAPTAWGPRISDATNRAYCRLSGTLELGYQHLVRAVVEQLDVGELEAPLVHWQGRYRRLGSTREA